MATCKICGKEEIPRMDMHIARAHSGRGGKSKKAGNRKRTNIPAPETKKQRNKEWIWIPGILH